MAQSWTGSWDGVGGELTVARWPDASAERLCARGDVEDEYGTDNATKWADLNNNGNDNEIAARIDRAIVLATDDFYNRMRNGQYVIPLSSTPASVVRYIAICAGVILYEARGVQDFDPATGQPQHRLHFQRTAYEKFCNELRAGKITIDAERISRNTTAPAVVK